jgi:hypothetical protein
MRVRIVVSLLLVCVLAYGARALAQPQNPLVGAWERLSLTNAEGVDIQPPEPAAFVIFSADGYYSQTVIPTGRNTLTRRIISHSNPNIEGTELVQEFRIEGDLLILTVPGSKAEARFRRAQKG